jgi:hypothetical protein
MPGNASKTKDLQHHAKVDRIKKITKSNARPWQLAKNPLG